MLRDPRGRWVTQEFQVVLGSPESLDPRALEDHEACQAFGEQRDAGVPEDQMDQLESRGPGARRAPQDLRADRAHLDSRVQLANEATQGSEAFSASRAPQAPQASRASQENRALRDRKGQLVLQERWGPRGLQV